PARVRPDRHSPGPARTPGWPRRAWAGFRAGSARRRAPGLQAGCRRRAAGPCRPGWTYTSIDVLHAQAGHVRTHERQALNRVQRLVHVALARFVGEEDDVGLMLAVGLL